MTEITKTIFMPAELGAKWVAALRSGEYVQCTGTLQSDEDTHIGYCCLGVLQMAIDGKVEMDESDDEFIPAELPSIEWLEQHDILFVNGGPRESNSPYLNALERSAHVANDNGATFAEIADAIEQELAR